MLICSVERGPLDKLRLLHLPVKYYLLNQRIFYASISMENGNL